MDHELPPEVLAYYNDAPEHERLATGVSQLEFVRTQEIISRRLDRPDMVVIDVGGGPGPYAAWLAAMGHEVHLIDPVPRLVAHARSLSSPSGRKIASCTVGDARSLDLRDQSADMVLLLGPLYHLTQGADRRRALDEACRVLVPGGVLVAAGISRFASALDGLRSDLFADPLFSQIVRRDLEDGIHQNGTGKLDYFTTAKFHRPDELAMEVAASGFASTLILGIEGPGWLFADFDARWSDARRREDILRIARALESEPSIQGISAHLAAVARRPLAAS